MYDCFVQSDVYLESTCTNQSFVSLGCRVVQGGCIDSYQSGYFFFFYGSGNWSLAAGNVTITEGSGVQDPIAVWHTMSLSVSGPSLTVTLDGSILATVVEREAQFNSGWAALGSSYDYVQYDNFQMNGTIGSLTGCGTGMNLTAARCTEIPSSFQLWTYSNTDNTIRLAHNQSLCVTAVYIGGGLESIAYVDECSTNNSAQNWSFSNKTISFSPMSNSSQCLDLAYGYAGQCAVVGVYDCYSSLNQMWYYDSNLQQITTPVDGYCLTLSAIGTDG